MTKNKGKSGASPKKKPLTFEQHKQIAGHLLNILEEVHALRTILADSCDAGYQAFRDAAYVLQTGKAAKKLQLHLEQELALHDGTDARSWALYFPESRPGARGSYGS